MSCDYENHIQILNDELSLQEEKELKTFSTYSEAINHIHSQEKSIKTLATEVDSLDKSNRIIKKDLSTIDTKSNSKTLLKNINNNIHAKKFEL